ncbi:MAG: metallophosphoesterase [Aigarchaeota archaeon]|nr:metallophosphoesterase [Aigarchaeota archaeon]
MKIGVVSDSHDNLPLIDQVVSRLNGLRVEAVLHAGDYVSPFTAPRFGNLKAKMFGVWGNNDGDRNQLTKLYSLNGAEMRGIFSELSLGGLTIALLHGHHEELLRSLIRSEGYDVVVSGHTHQPAVRKEGETLLLNSGEICAYLTQRSTFGIIDTDTRAISIMETTSGEKQESISL